VAKTKECNKCKTKFPATNKYFYKHKTCKDGIRNVCIRCEYTKNETPRCFVSFNGGIIEAKKCTGCERTLEATTDNYDKAKKGYLGLFAKCKDCRMRYREENKDRLQKKAQAYYQEHKEELCEKVMAYSRVNSDKVKRYLRKWNQENKHKKVIYAQRREAHKRKAPSDFTIEQWDECMKTFDDKCAYCGKSKVLEQDHFVPLSKGGEYTKDNIVPACKSCNVSKYNNDFFEWYLKKTYYSKQREVKILQYLNYHNKTQQLSIL
jgi:5-methylcytosine-specific restriction endonuclease McrA